MTGFNEAFIINGEKKDALIQADPKSADIIRPILRGRDIKRYGYSFADLWLINTHNGIKEKGIPPIRIEDYPAVKAHLDSFYPGLSKRADKGATPYNLRNCAYMDDFSKQKIIWGEISDKPKFAIDIDGKYVAEATTFLMVGNHLRYLLCYLNSALSEYFFAKYGTTTGMGTLRWKKYLVELLPIPEISVEGEQSFIDLLNSLLCLNNEEDIAEANSAINRKIYEMYRFTKEEIGFIEQSNMRGSH